MLGLRPALTELAKGYDVIIRQAAIPAEIAAATANFCEGRYSGTYNGRDVLLARAASRFLVRAGEEILIEPAPDADDHDVHAYLLGAVFGTLCHQRGITPLHASAIDVAGGCVAFVGESGAGKSTLVAALARAQHAIIGDDECFLQRSADGGLQVWPGTRQIRLWEDAKTALGLNAPGTKRATPGRDKYVVPVRPPQNPIGARPLRRVYQLHCAADDVIKVTRLRGAEAVEVVMQNIYPPGLAEHLGYQTHVFTVCAAVAREVPVFRFSRPRDFAAFDRGIECLERHLRTVAA